MRARYAGAVPNRDGTLKAREFLFHTEDLALAALPAGFPQPERKVMWTILQLHYGDPAVHFELQPQVARGIVELGLHFEGPAEVNEARAQCVADDAVTIAGALGPGWELEEWTASWRRLHRSFAFARLTDAFAREVAEQATRLIVALQPLVAGFDRVAAPTPAPRREGREGTRHWRQRAARR